MTITNIEVFRCGDESGNTGAARGWTLDWIRGVDPWPEPVDGEQLLDEMTGLVRRFVVLPKWGAEAVALWSLHTHAFELRDVSPYLGIESPEKRCGKTTLLTVLSELVSRPVVASNISSPALFRVIEEARPTLLIDEADTLLRRNDGLRGILNAGYGRRTAFVLRVASQGRGRRRVREASGGVEGAAKANRLAKYSCWCPKAIAAIGKLPDTLADRCIVLRMQRKGPGEFCERLKSLEATALRRKCVRFVMDAAPEIASAQPAMPGGLNDRAADVWEPLLALADLAGVAWSDRARQAATALAGASEPSQPMGALLFDVWVTFMALKADRLFSHQLAEALNAFSQRPWMEGLKGGRVTERWLAERLREYGVRSRLLRIDGKILRGYELEDFREVCQRYVPPSELETFVKEREGEG